MRRPLLCCVQTRLDRARVGDLVPSLHSLDSRWSMREVKATEAAGQALGYLWMVIDQVVLFEGIIQ
jgi:hypothetical protein